MASHNKIVVVESEKSPKICSTNWKEGMVLKRNLVDLDRSELTVVNRITVDQKILLNRFQTKLGRSKMSYARTMGNMKMQKKLREKTTFVLNTNIGHNQEQDETLQRLWNNGRKEYEDRINSDVYLRKKKHAGTFSSIEDDTKVPDSPKQEDDPLRPYTALNVRPNTAVTLVGHGQAFQRRPFTSIQLRPKQGSTELLSPTYFAAIPTENDDGDKEPELAEDTTKPAPERKPRPQTARASVQEDEEFVAAQETKKSKRRPSTAGGYLQSKVEPSEPQTPKHIPFPTASSVRQSLPTKLFNVNNAGIGSMFKNEDFEISLLDFQRFCVYSANYESRVKKYGEKIKPLRTDRAHSVDYFSAKLQESVKKAQKTLKMEAAAEATPEDIKRATGNLSVRSLTLHNIEEKYRGITPISSPT